MWRFAFFLLLLTRCAVWAVGSQSVERIPKSLAEHGGLAPLEEGGGSPPAAPGGAPKSLVPATVNGFTMTVATEVGDKTFCIAAVMAMRYNRLLVFSGAAGALLVMTVLSVGIGVALPALLPKEYTHYAAAALFVYFGVKLLQEARAMPADGGGEHSELAEAEEELEKKLGEGASSPRAGGAAGAATPAANSTPSESDLESESDPSAKQETTKRAAASSHYLQEDWAVLTQAFTITFLAEWGDRSQIATIAMAAAQHPVGGACPNALPAHAHNTHTKHTAARPCCFTPPPTHTRTHPHTHPPTRSVHWLHCGARHVHGGCSGGRAAPRCAHQRAGGGLFGRRAVPPLCDAQLGGGARGG